MLLRNNLHTTIAYIWSVQFNEFWQLNMLTNHHHNQDISITPKRFLLSFISTPSLPRFPVHTTVLLFVCRLVCILYTSKWNHTVYSSFCLIFSIQILRFIHVVYISSSCLSVVSFCCSVILCGMNMPHFV